MYLRAGVLLLLVVHEIRHDGLVVWDVHAEVDGDGLAAAVMTERIAATTTGAAAAAVNGSGVQSGRSEQHTRQNSDRRGPQHPARVLASASRARRARRRLASTLSPEREIRRVRHQCRPLVRAIAVHATDTRMTTGR